MATPYVLRCNLCPRDWPLDEQYQPVGAMCEHYKELFYYGHELLDHQRMKIQAGIPV
jgi:hypothetical protein